MYRYNGAASWFVENENKDTTEICSPNYPQLICLIAIDNVSPNYPQLVSYFMSLSNSGVPWWMLRWINISSIPSVRS